jgi:hypothetical protein
MVLRKDMAAEHRALGLGSCIHLMLMLLPMSSGFSQWAGGLPGVCSPISRIQHQALLRCVLRAPKHAMHSLSMQSSDEGTIPGTWKLTTMIEVLCANFVLSRPLCRLCPAPHCTGLGLVLTRASGLAGRGKGGRILRHTEP